MGCVTSLMVLVVISVALYYLDNTDTLDFLETTREADGVIQTVPSVQDSSDSASSSNSSREQVEIMLVLRMNVSAGRAERHHEGILESQNSAEPPPLRTRLARSPRLSSTSRRMSFPSPHPVLFILMNQSH